MIIPIWGLVLIFALTPVFVIWNLAYYGLSADPAGYFWGAVASAAWIFCAVTLWRERRGRNQ